MTGKSPLSATEDQRAGLVVLAGSRDRGEADRARAVLLTLAGWISPKIAEAFGVREDTMRLWRSTFMDGGIDALKASVAPGPAPVESEAALRVVTPLLEAPVADRRNWTIPRLRAGLRLQLRKQQVEAGDIVLLHGDESEALTHPYLARVRAKSGADLRVPAPGQARKVAMLGTIDHVTRELIVHTSPTKRSSDFIAQIEQLDRRHGPKPGEPITLNPAIGLALPSR